MQQHIQTTVNTKIFRSKWWKKPVASALCLIALQACGQTHTQNTNIQNQHMENKTPGNPLLCDPATGVCEIPNNIDSTFTMLTPGQPKPVHLVYFTDPICSSCWGIEPQLRKLKLEYGAYFEIEYRMGGLLPGWDSYSSGSINGPRDVAGHWDEASKYYQMPIDGDVWLTDPLSSSYPPSIAFNAAEMQNQEKALVFLRRLKEMVFTEKKNITKWEYLEQAAIESGLDAKQLKIDFEGAAKALFEADLQLSRQSGVRGFPTIFFQDADDQSIKIYGSKTYAEYERALLHLFPDAQKATYDRSAEALFKHFPTLTTLEFAVLTDQSYPQAEKALQDLKTAKKIQAHVTKNGNVWMKNEGK